jgi:hypothetical protein
MQDRCSASQPATASADPAATMHEFFTSTHWALQTRRSGLGLTEMQPASAKSAMSVAATSFLVMESLLKGNTLVRNAQEGNPGRSAPSLLGANEGT